MKLSVYIMVLLFCFGLSHAAATRDKMLEEVKDKLVIEGKSAEDEDIEANGKVMPNACMGDACFKVIQYERCNHDHDCGCPTSWYYYSPMPFTSHGVTWIPVSGQWKRIGWCLGYGEKCHKKSWPFEYQTCSQWWEKTPFLYYRQDFFQMQLKYFIFPDYCYCPCGSPYCPRGRAADQSEARRAD